MDLALLDRGMHRPGICWPFYQAGRCGDPAFMAFWTSQNMPVPEPVGVLPGVIAFGLLFSGVYHRPDLLRSYDAKVAHPCRP